MAVRYVMLWLCSANIPNDQHGNWLDLGSAPDRPSPIPLSAVLKDLKIRFLSKASWEIGKSEQILVANL